MNRRRLLVLGAVSALPACSAGGSDPTLWSSGGNPPGAGAGGGTSTGPGAGGATSTGPGAGGATSTTGVSTSTTSTSTSTTATSSTASSSSGGMICTTGGNSHRLAFSQYPSLMNAGGSASFQGSTYSDPSCGQPDIIVVSKGGGQFLAFSASCAHQCCTVKVSGSQFRCPCHGATFNTTTGAPTNNVTHVPLAALTVCADSTGVAVSW